MLINKQSLATIIGRMSAPDWKQWAMDRQNWIQHTIQSAFDKFVEQECKDALNVAAG
jgi:hypothetical protein